MLFETPDQFIKAPRRAVTVFGMAGVGKTRLSNLLRKNRWFHYSVDYRIGTRHMGEYIVDNFKAEAMKVPFLAQLLRSDSIYISSNITFDNLDPLSSYLGTPGNTELGGRSSIAWRKFLPCSTCRTLSIAPRRSTAMTTSSLIPAVR
jgi:hypothetical protein